MNRLLPFDLDVINEDMKGLIKKFDNRAIPKQSITEKLTFIEDLYYKFLSKGLATKKINQLLAASDISSKSNEEIFITLAKNCRPFDENELSDFGKLLFVLHY